MTQQEAEVKLKVNSKEALDKINKLEQEAEQLRQKFNDCFRKGDTHGIAETAKKLNKVNKEIENMRTNAANINAALKRLDQASPKELRQTIKQINAELNSGRVPRGSKQWKEYCDQLKKVKRELAEVNDELNDHGSLLDRAKNKFNDWGAAAAAGIAAFAGVVLSGKEAVEAYAEMEQEEANVRKFTGMTAEQVADLNEEFKKIDTRTSRVELNKLAQEAGRLGKRSKEDVLGFVKAANQINVALDDLGEGATLTLSKLTGIFGDEAKYGTEQSLLKVGSVINELSQNCSASAPYLADFSKRLAGVGAQAGMSIPQIMAFAAVLDTQGQAVEMSATAFSQLIMKLYQDPSKFAKAACIDVKQFTDLLKTDANVAVLTLLEALKRAGNIQTLAPIFEEMGMDGARASGVLAALAGNIDQVRAQQIEANKAFNEGTSVSKEYDVQNSTVQAGLEKARKGFTEMAASLGEQLIPVMSKCISGTSALMRVMSGLISFVTKYKGAIIALTAAVLAYNVAIRMQAAIDKTVLLIQNALVAAQKIYHTAQLLVAAGYNAIRRNATRAAAATRSFNAAIKANPLGLFAAALAAVISMALTLKSKMDNAREAAERLRKEQEEFVKSTRDIKEATAEYAKAEQTKLDVLYKAATDEKRSRDERLKAVETLKKQYPDYFRKLSAEAILVGQAKKQYDRLTQSILANAEARAAAEKIKENTAKIIDLRLEIKNRDIEDKRLAEQIADVRAEMGDIRAANSGNRVVFNGAQMSAVDYAQTSSQRERESALVTAYNENQTARTDAKRQIAILEDNNEWLRKTYNATEALMNGGADSTPPAISYTGDPTIRETKSQRQAREKAEREAKKNAAAAEKAAKEALKNDLKAEKAAWEEKQAANEAAYNSDKITYVEYLQTKEKLELDYIAASKTVLKKKGLADSEEYAKLAKKEEEIKTTSLKRIKDAQFKEIDARRDYEETINLAAYSSGQIDYFDYRKKQQEIDIAYYKDKLKVLQDAGLTDTEEYDKLLHEQESMLLRHLKKEAELRAEEMERKYQADTQKAELEYYDSSSSLYMNESALNERLFRLKLDYLEKRRDAELKNSDKYREYQAQIDDLVADERLRKERKTHELLLQYSKEYRDKDAKARRESEEALVDELYKKGLISEVDYQKAKSEIKKKYENEELERSQKVHSEYTDMVKNLYDAFSNLFENLSKGGVEFWNSLTVAAQASFAIMSAALSQYTAYSNAERDLELAKMEKRYDDEIAAAGTNTKKKEQLEKKKQEETAKIKKKYNDRAMKIELAQAIAQTAQAAIAAYASASAIPVTGWIMAPIAAALATAAGMAQVATIKKQHEAEAIGYYEGGYTGGNDYKKEAGLVHEGEFVANHNAVNNPHLSGLFRLLDYAQRNNTVGSLTAEDVSNALGQGQGVSARGEVAGATPTIVTNSIDTSALDTLNALLADGIEAVVILDGERGLHNKYQHYQKLINNPRR